MTNPDPVALALADAERLQQEIVGKAGSIRVKRIVHFGRRGDARAGAVEMTETQIEETRQFMDKLDRLDVAQQVQTTPAVTRLVVRLFRRRFNAVANRILLRAYERGVINSKQMHFLAAQFDPTQDGVVGSL